MEAVSDSCSPNTNLNFFDGGFFPIEEALEKITYSQDKSLVRMSYKRYLDFHKERDEITV
jgi:hypothetical protein